MKFNDFLKIYADIPFIDSSTFSARGKAHDLRRQVNGWLKKGYLLPLKKGLYIFAEPYRKINLSPLSLANFLVTPSYISTEYALNYYDFIPERVTVFTSVTTKKTRMFDNSLGRFEYRTIKTGLFFGFNKVTLSDGSFFIASPEKTLCDYFYFTPAALPRRDWLEESMRLQNIEDLNINLLSSYRGKYDKRTAAVIDVLIDYVKEERS
jgi:predicted transcriptional regulator of viral defense system